jgi:hypothetical protein
MNKSKTKTTKELLAEARKRAQADLKAHGWKGPGHGLTVKVKISKPAMEG